MSLYLLKSFSLWQLCWGVLSVLATLLVISSFTSPAKCQTYRWYPAWICLHKSNSDVWWTFIESHAAMLFRTFCMFAVLATEVNLSPMNRISHIDVYSIFVTTQCLNTFSTKWWASMAVHLCQGCCQECRFGFHFVGIAQSHQRDVIQKLISRCIGMSVLLPS